MKRIICILIACCFMVTGCSQTNSETQNAKEIFHEQQEVQEELNEKSIGANKEIVQLLTAKKDDVQYELNEEDYTVSFVLEEKEDDSWTPFISGKQTEFTVSDASIIEYETAKKIIRFTAKKAGECIITATSEDKVATAYIKVKPINDERDKANSVDYYIYYLSKELEPLDDETRALYLYNLADYAALQQASSTVDGNLLSAMAAACLLYPTSYLLNNYGSLLMDQQQYKEALTWLSIADEADPNNPVILTNMAECCYELGDMNTALVYTDVAIASQSDFGLAHLLQACIYANQGNGDLFIESLFRSAKTCWTELTTKLMNELYIYTKEVMENYDRMISTKEHLDIFMEAASYGTTSDGRDTIEHQVNLPHPAQDITMALTAQQSYADQASQIRKQIEDLYGDYKYYEGSAYTDDPRHVFLLRFHMLFYEFEIENKCGSLAWSEEVERIKNQYWQDYEELYEPVEAQIAKWDQEVAENGYLATGALLVAPFDSSTDWMAIAEEKALWLAENAPEYMEQTLLLQIETAKSARDMWHDALIKMELAKIQGYESITKPLLEEYYQRMNAILGYTTNDKARIGFEKRVLYTINEEGIVIPLGMAGAEIEDVNMFEMEIWYYNYALNQQYSIQSNIQSKEIEARAIEAKWAKAQAEKQEWGQSYTLGLPPLSPIQVYIGMNGDNLTYGYGAFGHDIMYERNSKTGETTEAILTKTHTFLSGVSQLANNISGVLGFVGDGKDASKLSGLHRFAKGQAMGGLPSYEESVTSGTVYTYNADGELVDVSRVRKTSYGGGWGLISGAVETETKSSRHNGNLSNSLNSTTKIKINIAGMEFTRQVNGVVK